MIILKLIIKAYARCVYYNLVWESLKADRKKMRINGWEIRLSLFNRFPVDPILLAGRLRLLQSLIRYSNRSQNMLKLWKNRKILPTKNFVCSKCLPHFGSFVEWREGRDSFTFTRLQTKKKSLFLSQKCTTTCSTCSVSLEWIGGLTQNSILYKI